jgi:hypothetical protein
LWQSFPRIWLPRYLISRPQDRYETSSVQYSCYSSYRSWLEFRESCLFYYSSLPLEKFRSPWSWSLRVLSGLNVWVWLVFSFWSKCHRSL